MPGITCSAQLPLSLALRNSQSLAADQQRNLALDVIGCIQHFQNIAGRPTQKSSVDIGLDLAKTEPQGRTALFDSVDQALSLFCTPQPGDAIYVVSDGGDNRSRVSFSKLKEKLVSHGVRVFVFALPVEQFRTTSEEHYSEDRMEGLAEFSGGYVIRVPWSEIAGKEQSWLERSAIQIRDQVQAMYEVKLDIPSASGRVRKLKVVVNKESRNGGTLTYARQLAACPSQP